MADDVVLNLGSGGDTVAADEISSKKYQRIKLIQGIDGVNDGDVSATAPLNVQTKKDQLRTKVNTSSLTLASTAYTAGDQVGTLLTVANAARASGGGGRITQVMLLDVNDVIGAYDVVFFDQSVTLSGGDNGVFSISDSDADNLIALVQLAGGFDITNNRIAMAQNLSIPYVCVGGTSLYAGLINRFGHTFFTANTDLHLHVWVERD